MEELISKYFAGEASAREVEQVEAWRSESKENAEEYLEMRKAWMAVDKGAAPDGDRLHSIFSHDEGNESEPIQVVPLWNQRLFRVAIVALLILGGVFATIQLSKTPPPIGEAVKVIGEYDLPDGSEVTLQRGASITMEDFDDERTVYLQGIAYFDIEPDEDNPFTVITKSAHVQVLGTSFMIRSADEEGLTEVMVESGEVTLGQNPEAFQGKSMKIHLRNGEMGKLAVGRRGIQKKKIADENFLAWKTKVITFRNSTLSSVSHRLNEVYGVQLTFDNPKLSKCTLSAKFNQKEPEEVVDIIAKTFDLTYSKTVNGYMLSGESCR